MWVSRSNYHSHWQTRVQHKHKLKHHFYSPNIQSKSIIDSQTSTVKIQPFFFFFLRYREGHCLKIVVYPVEFTCCFFITIMLMVHYLYKLLRWPSELSTFSGLGHVVFANWFALFGVQSNSTNHREAYTFDFQMPFCDYSNCLWLLVHWMLQTKPRWFLVCLAGWSELWGLFANTM